MEIKKIIPAAALLLSVTMLHPRRAQAQSIPQLIEQVILDKEKLAELKTILNDMYNSYQIIDQGYTHIKNIVQGNFNLHKAYLDGLLAVSPTVRSYVRVADILSTAGTIASEYRTDYTRAVSGGHFTAAELGYMSLIYGKLFSRSLSCLDELTMVTTDSELRMSDAERLRAIDAIYTDISGQLSLLRSFSTGNSIQDLQRARAAGDIGAVRSFYGIKN